MWPWGHAAVGYLLYSVFIRRSRGQPPEGLAVLALALGTQLPDLIDKPLAWSVAVLPTGRSLGHSLLTVALVLGVGWWVVGHGRRRYLVALGVGWVSHSVGDMVNLFAGGDFAYANFLLWPVLTTPPYGTEQSFAAHILVMEVTPFFVLQLGLTLLAVIVWWRDGMPGLRRALSVLPGVSLHST